MRASKALKTLMESEESFWKELTFPGGDYRFKVTTLKKYLQHSNKKVTCLNLDDAAVDTTFNYNESHGLSRSFAVDSSGLGVDPHTQALYDHRDTFRSLCDQNYFTKLRVLRLSQDFEWITYETLYVLLSSAASNLQELSLVLPRAIRLETFCSLLDRMRALRVLEVCILSLLLSSKLSALTNKNLCAFS